MKPTKKNNREIKPTIKPHTGFGMGWAEYAKSNPDTEISKERVDKFASSLERFIEINLDGESK